MIELKEINETNWRMVLSLKIDSSQEKYVSTSDKILAKAYAYRNQRSTAKAIYFENTLVGIIMWRDCDEEKAYDLDQMLIDSRYQGNGYGKDAINKMLELMKEDKKYSRILLCYISGNNVAKELYSNLGFYHTGVVDDDEVIMAYDLDK